MHFHNSTEKTSEKTIEKTFPLTKDFGLSMKNIGLCYEEHCYQIISGQCSISINPENIRKSLVF